MNRKKSVFINSMAPLIYQFAAVICGFILPRLILTNYGSEVNGLVNSITQFLSVISFFELGMGAVVPSALYEPLAKNDKNKISSIFVAASRFYRILALGLLIYIIVLSITYPILYGGSFSNLYISTLIIAISISFFSQYYFGIVERLLLTADQKGYIYYNTQTITLVISTIVSSLIIVCGGSIQLVKIVISLIYMVRPIVFRIYVERHYDIDRKYEYTTDPIPQKWNGIAQHFAAFVLGGTDTIVLTIFSSLKNVSIYSVYYLVISGINSIVIALVQGIQPVMGEMWAKRETNSLKQFFRKSERIIHLGVVFLYSCTSVLIVPFIRIYTSGINDTNYINYGFSILLCIAYMFYCLRLPYNIIILVCNHYKQTQHIFILSAIINLCISCITVFKYGLIGVAIGTLVAMIYQMIHMAVYMNRHLLHFNCMHYLKLILMDIALYVPVIVLQMRFNYVVSGYLSWIVLAIKVSIVLIIWLIIVFVVFNPDLVREKAKRFRK